MMLLFKDGKLDILSWGSRGEMKATWMWKGTNKSEQVLAIVLNSILEAACCAGRYRGSAAGQDSLQVLEGPGKWLLSSMEGFQHFNSW